MDYEKGEKRDLKHESSLFDTFQAMVNTVNHGLIAIATFYLSWYAWNVGFVEYQAFHAYFTTIGYQLFMSEGIMAMYSENTYTKSVTSRAIKTRIHYVLQIIGGSCALFGIPYQIVQREINKKLHFCNTHGIAGLVSGIFLVLTILSGCSALFSIEFRKYIKPFFSKAAHQILSSICYCTGMFALIVAYNTRSWIKNNDPGDVRIIMMWCLSFVMAFTMFGPLRTMVRQCKGQ